jgi:hypothetical protein
VEEGGRQCLRSAGRGESSPAAVNRLRGAGGNRAEPSAGEVNARGIWPAGHERHQSTEMEEVGVRSPCWCAKSAGPQPVSAPVAPIDEEGGGGRPRRRWAGTHGEGAEREEEGEPRVGTTGGRIERLVCATRRENGKIPSNAIVGGASCILQLPLRHPLEPV